MYYQKEREKLSRIIHEFFFAQKIIDEDGEKNQNKTKE